MPDLQPIPPPCPMCATSLDALNILGMALYTSVQAARHIRVPLPPDTLPFRAAGPEEIPQELRDTCAQLGYNLVPAPTTVTQPQPPPDHSPDSQRGDTLSAQSGSTDWDETYGISPSTPPPESSEATGHEASTQDSERWYAVIVGRQPGVYSGGHNIGSNVTDVPGGFVCHFSSQHLAQAAYNKALTVGHVVEVTYIISKRTLSLSSHV